MAVKPMSQLWYRPALSCRLMHGVQRLQHHRGIQCINMYKCRETSGLAVIAVEDKRYRQEVGSSGMLAQRSRPSLAGRLFAPLLAVSSPAPSVLSSAAASSVLPAPMALSSSPVPWLLSSPTARIRRILNGSATRSIKLFLNLGKTGGIRLKIGYAADGRLQTQLLASLIRVFPLQSVAGENALFISVFGDAPGYRYIVFSARCHWLLRTLGTSGGRCQEEDRLKEVHFEILKRDAVQRTVGQAEFRVI